MPSIDDRSTDRPDGLFGRRVSRRRVASAAGGLLALLVGCAGRPPTGRSATPTPVATPTPEPTSTPEPTPTATGTDGDLPAGPRPYPDRPARLSSETVREYVHDVEHARTYNVLYEPDMTDSSLDCRTVYDTAAGGGHYVLAACSGYANYPDAHADWGQTPALYFVSDGLTVRVGDYDSQYFHCTDVFASEDPSENFAEVCGGGDAAYRVYNVHPEPHTVEVTVEFLAEDGDEPILERSYTLAPAAGVEQGSVTYRKGTYRVRASLDDGPEATYRWELNTKPTYEDPSVTVLVTPAGGLTIRRVPFDEL